MPTAYFLIGPPASGKSTWRASFLSHTKAEVISTDDFIDEYAAQNNITYSQAFKVAPLKDFENQAKEKLRQAVKNGENIIIDRTNLTPKSRNNFLSLIPDSYRTKAIVFNVPREELDQRLDSRAKATGKHIGKNIIDSMIASYVPPSSDEFDEIEKI